MTQISCSLRTELSVSFVRCYRGHFLISSQKLDTFFKTPFLHVVLKNCVTLVTSFEMILIAINACNSALERYTLV